MVDRTHTKSRTLFELLRHIDADDEFRASFQRDPGRVLEEAQLSSAFSSADARADFVATFATLEGEAWLATFHAFLDWAEGNSQDAPAVPNVRFSLDGDGHVRSVANRGGNSRSNVNPFYSRERPGSSASDVVASQTDQQSGAPAVTIFDGYEDSEVSAELSKRYISRYYQRTMIKHRVRQAGPAAAPGPITLNYRDLQIDLAVTGDGDSGLQVAGATVAASNL